MPTPLTIRESITIFAPPELVWDFTQDFSQRRTWDSSVLAAETVDAGPPPRVRVRFRGGLACVFEYRAYERPLRTSLAMTAIESPLIAGGGGSWSYERVTSGTRWTQSNSLVLRETLVARLLRPFLGAALRRATRRAMRTAKRIVEQANASRSAAP